MGYIKLAGKIEKRRLKALIKSYGAGYSTSPYYLVLSFNISKRQVSRVFNSLHGKS